MSFRSNRKSGLLPQRENLIALDFKRCDPRNFDLAVIDERDTVACEGFFGRLKTEFFYPRDWKATTVEQFIKDVDSYIRWYNEKRIKISLGYLSPIEYRESLGLAP